MKSIIGFLIFCLVLFVYLHVQYHLKKGDELEIYEMEDVSKEKLEEVCDIRQPILFDFDNEKIMELTRLDFVRETYPAFEVKIRNTKEDDTTTEMYIRMN